MKKSITVSVVLAAFVLVVGVVAAIADDTDQTTYRFGHLDEVLDEMVESGDLSQELADDIRARMAEKVEEQLEDRPSEPGRHFRFGPFSDQDGTFEFDPEDLPEALTDPDGPFGDLGELLEDGELSPEDRDQILEQLREQEWFPSALGELSDLLRRFLDDESSDDESGDDEEERAVPRPFLGEMPDLMRQFLEDGELSDDERAQLQERMQEQLEERLGEGTEGFDFEFGPFSSEEGTRRFRGFSGDSGLPDLEPATEPVPAI